MIFFEITLIVAVITFMAWLFGVDGRMIAAFYVWILLLTGVIALFAALTAYFITLFMPPC